MSESCEHFIERLRRDLEGWEPQDLSVVIKGPYPVPIDRLDLRRLIKEVEKGMGKG